MNNNNNNNNKKIGAVLVEGAGIAGVQAALDLANSGFKVYLIERSAAIGGMMAQLDKTFPTGDCATCIVSPKLVECARNFNIEILTLSELYRIEGEPGRFTVTIKKSPRYVDEKICNACGDCTAVCPVAISDRFNRGLGTRKAIAKQYVQAVPNLPAILKLGHAPCKTTCPANINVQGYIQLIKKKEYIKAVNLIRERNPLSAICGRVCTHPCETACTRGQVDAPVAIRQLKRFASDKEMEMVASGQLALPEEKTPSPHARKVAIVGAGPSGLTAAQDLADRGYAVTVYEARRAAGGMLRWGIPEYRLPEKVLDYEIELIRRKGVSFVFNCQVGKDITIDKLREDHDAVFIGMGLQKGSTLNVEGENLNGVVQGLDFLKAVKDGTARIKDSAFIIGGGNVAIDVALSAKRIGAQKVQMACLESWEEMPANEEEKKQALEEGVIIHTSWGPKRIKSSKGEVNGIELKKCTAVFDNQKKFNPTYDKTKTTDFETAMVIVAIGSRSDPAFFGTTPDLPVNQRGNIIVDQYGLTEIEGFFAGGDIVTGPATVIEAVAAGKRAAESIDRYVKKEDQQTARFENTIAPVAEELLPSTEDVEKRTRAQAPELPVKQRINNFAEIEAAFSEEDALAETERCLNCALCSECRECVAACEKNAINHVIEEQMIELEVGSVILTPGFEEFPAARKGEFGFGRYGNVITNVQFERMLSAAGPFEGHIVRPSGGGEAKRIAFIQCVGSRDSKCGNDYCSSVCCMATIKQAMVAREHVEGLDATIFYMDIRAHGKDFDQYYERARSETSIHFVRSMPSRIVQIPDTKNLQVRFAHDSRDFEEREFDLVVLATGIDPKTSVTESISRLGIELNGFGFCATNRLLPLTTSRPGVFVAGAFQEPKDIPETVTQASGAASMAMELLAGFRNTLVIKKSYPDERDITDEELRIGVFVCHCGMNIASVVDVTQVVDGVKSQPGVVFAKDSMFTCSDTSLSEIKEKIREYRLNRIVVASCTPRTHEPLFRETLREAGLNPYLFELANIRDQCSWVHPLNPKEATNKAIDLVRMSIARAQSLAPLGGELLEINQSGLVIGGGMSGMTAALSLADQGFKTSLVECTDRLGGNLLNLYSTLEKDDISSFTAALIQRVENHPNITVYLETELTRVAGHIGNFLITLSRKEEKIDVSCGAVIVATGAKPAETSEFLYDKSKQVLTQVELEKQLHEKSFSTGGGNVVMIQCVGSRNSERPYCSRLCCSMAVKNALSIKENDPDAHVFVLYRDVRTYGFRETYYKKAREVGVIFIRYHQDSPPKISDAQGLVVTVDSPDFPESLAIEADHVVLSTGVVPGANNKAIADMFKVPLNADGFYVEAHLKLRPVDFASEGIFLCGLAHSPKFVDENISQARAAAARAATVLSKTHLDVGAQVSHVNQNKCISCMTCLKVCPYGAPLVNRDQKAEIVGAKCMGCGICAAECPARAIQLSHFETDQFCMMLDNLLAVGNSS
jgi:heterodisulfide reductase subunit A-like polyferredoxin